MANQCVFCIHMIGRHEDHFNCAADHGHDNHDWYSICRPCFFQWHHGDVSADNTGFRMKRCGACGDAVGWDEIKRLFTAEQFEEFDAAMATIALQKDKDYIHCPGVDCSNGFLKPKRTRTKRKCRRAQCDACETVFCCQCGEAYTKEHQRMKCGPYRKWKMQHDEATQSLVKWKKARSVDVKKCPTCKQDVEKNGGCSSMHCTNCDTRFCWRCLKIDCRCE